MAALEIDGNLSPDAKLYRYTTLESFMAFVESEKVHLTKVKLWDDKWEVILSRLPTEKDNGELGFSIYSFWMLLYGQCWSLVNESDAMWRIYSQSKTGIQIATSVGKFNLIGGFKRGYLGKVAYFENPAELLELASSNTNPFSEAMYKRQAFEHEREVRFLTHSDFLTPSQPTESASISLPVDISAFIEGITIDPRAEDWYLDALTKYCERIGLSVKPVKSKLYEPDPHLKIGLVKKWVPVKKK